jgi:hypothetical protein
MVVDTLNTQVSCAPSSAVGSSWCEPARCVSAELQVARAAKTRAATKAVCCSASKAMLRPPGLSWVAQEKSTVTRAQEDCSATKNSGSSQEIAAFRKSIPLSARTPTSKAT